MICCVEDLRYCKNNRLVIPTCHLPSNVWTLLLRTQTQAQFPCDKDLRNLRVDVMNRTRGQRCRHLESTRRKPMDRNDETAICRRPQQMNPTNIMIYMKLKWRLQAEALAASEKQAKNGIQFGNP